MNLKIGHSYYYYDTPTSPRCPCKLIRILEKGDYIVYEFLHDNHTGIGATIYPIKFKDKLREDRKEKISKIEKLYNNK